MMIRTMAVSALSMGLLLSAAGTASADQGHKGPKVRQGSLQLPITGTVVGGGTFAGTLSLVKFVARDGQAMAVGMVSGSATSAAGVSLGTALVGPIAFPVHVGPGAAAAATAAPGAVVTQQVCELLHLEIGAVNLDLLGLIVMTQPVVLDLAADPAGTNILGQLICTILETVGNVIGLVDLLNQLLGLLIGLLGALIPG